MIHRWIGAWVILLCLEEVECMFQRERTFGTGNNYLAESVINCRIESITW